MPIIELRDVSKVFKEQSGAFQALDHVNLKVNAGDVYGIVGLSGAGKSTLIRLMNRLETPTEGDVLYEGESILSLSPAGLRAHRRQVGMIFQQFHLFMQRTVFENVRYPLDIAGVPRQEANGRVEQLLQTVDLLEKRHAYPAQLSGGQQQRVGIARTLAMNPRVLLCDEATSALDPMTTESILELLSRINRSLGLTVILITHEMAVVRKICNRVAIIDGGRIAETGTVDEVFRSTKSDAGKRLFGVLPQSPDEDLDIPCLRIVFDGANREKPMMSELVRDTGVLVNILSANIKRIGDKTYGQMLIERPGDENIKTLVAEHLIRQGLIVEEVNRT